MINYDEYINKLKKESASADYGRMFSRIEQKTISGPKLRLALAGAIVFLLIGFTVYFGSQSLQTPGNDTLMSYVFEQEDIDGPLLDYVFYDNGTFLE